MSFGYNARGLKENFYGIFFHLIKLFSLMFFFFFFFFFWGGGGGLRLQE